MTDDMTQQDREDLVKRINSLSKKKREEFFRSNRNQALVDAALTDIANKVKHRSGRYKGQPNINAISRLTGIPKGGFLSGVFKGDRTIPNTETKIQILEGWTRLGKAQETMLDRAQKRGGNYNPARFVVEDNGKIRDLNTGWFT